MRKYFELFITAFFFLIGVNITIRFLLQFIPIESLTRNEYLNIFEHSIELTLFGVYLTYRRDNIKLSGNKENTQGSLPQK